MFINRSLVIFEHTKMLTFTSHPASTPRRLALLSWARGSESGEIMGASAERVKLNFPKTSDYDRLGKRQKHTHHYYAPALADKIGIVFEAILTQGQIQGNIRVTRGYILVHMSNIRVTYGYKRVTRITWRFREQKHSRARRKRLHCRLCLNPPATKRNYYLNIENIIFFFIY